MCDYYDKLHNAMIKKMMIKASCIIRILQNNTTTLMYLALFVHFKMVFGGRWGIGRSAEPRELILLKTFFRKINDYWLYNSSLTMGRYILAVYYILTDNSTHCTSGIVSCEWV